VIHFLEDLSSHARPFAEQNLAYAAKKLREQRYAFFEQKVKRYFVEPTAVEGLSQLIQKLFSVNIRADQAPVRHPDVKFFRFKKDGKLIGQFYLDLYARNGKRGGAWMDGACPTPRRQ
jgi:oligopeptidase A